MTAQFNSRHSDQDNFNLDNEYMYFLMETEAGRIIFLIAIAVKEGRHSS